LIVAKSETATKIFPSNFADMVFIDGAHDYEHVCKDIDFALKVIKSDGIIVGHDYDKLAKFPIGIDYINENAHKDWDEESGVHCGVIRAVQEKFSQFGLPREEPESSLWIANPEWKR
jgi:hypothetical protein